MSTLNADVISVVGGGWSFKEVDHSKIPGMVIATNDAGLMLRRPVQHIVTMDRLWTEYRWPKLIERKVSFWARRSALQNVKTWRDHSWVSRFENNEKTVEFSETADVLNGTNSGGCALNLAYILRPRILYMFAFDMCHSPAGEAYWYPPYPWTNKKGGTKPGWYNRWAREFDQIAAQFAKIETKVVNVSSVSRITSFEKRSPAQMGMAV